jgi:hypothetical protein
MNTYDTPSPGGVSRGPNKLGLPGAQQFIKHTQLRDRPNRPKRLVQWGRVTPFKVASHQTICINETV